MQTVATLVALPFSVVMVLICWATYIAFRREWRAYDRAQRAQLVEQIGAYYDLEVESHDGADIKLPPWLKRRRLQAFRRYQQTEEERADSES